MGKQRRTSPGRTRTKPSPDALSRWEGEGGAIESEEPATDASDTVSEEEATVLQLIGAAVLLKWNELPTDFKRELFQSASIRREVDEALAWKSKVARFLHQHKDDAASSRLKVSKLSPPAD